MDSNFWFYTLSAIPQTLGAVIALSATFVIFKLNHIESRTKKEYDEITEWIMPLHPEIEIPDITKLDDSSILQKLREGMGKLNREESNLGFDGYDKLRDLYGEVINSYKRHFSPTEARIYDYLQEKNRILSSLLEVRRDALRRLKASLVLTVLPIVGSIIFLPLYQQVSYCRVVIVSALVIFAVIGICYTAYSVWKIARPQLR
jgi:hypothetical protein